MYYSKEFSYRISVSTSFFPFLYFPKILNVSTSPFSDIIEPFEKQIFQQVQLTSPQLEQDLTLYFLVYIPELEQCFYLAFESGEFCYSLSGYIDFEDLLTLGFDFGDLSFKNKEYEMTSQTEENPLLKKVYDYIFFNKDELGDEVPLSSLNIQFDNFDLEGVQELKNQIKEIIEGSKKKKELTKPDPIAALLMSIDRPSLNEPLSEEEYEQFEQARIADKWRGNRIGSLNEAILNIFSNIKLSEAGKLDVIVQDENEGTVAIAEVKNRYNTMNAASAIRTRQAMENLVLERGSTYYNADAVLVERIPKSNGEEAKFNPSNPARGSQGENTDKIKRMGMQQFLCKYCQDELAYIKAVILIAQVLHENKILPNDFNMKFIFKLLKKSLS